MSFLRDINILIFFLITVFAASSAVLLYRAHLVNKLYPVSYKRIIGKIILRFLALIILCFAWAGPHLNEKGEEVEIKTDSRDVIIALDLSHSILSNDLKPNRLTKAKLAIKKIVNSLEGNNFGLVVFTRSAFTQCPITYDKSYFMKMLNFCDPMLLSNQGTDLLPALEMSLDRLILRDQIDFSSKAIVLVSDGEDFGDELEPIIKRIKDAKIKTFCLGIGTKKGGPIKMGNEFKRDKQRNIVKTSLNSAPLKKLANKTGGEYYEISDQGNQVGSLIKSINQLKGHSAEKSLQQAPKTTYYHYLLFLALLLLVIDFVIKLRVTQV